MGGIRQLLLNTELKILARILANCLPSVISDQIGPRQNYDMKGRSIQTICIWGLKVLEVDTEATLISLDQFKAFVSINYQFLATVFETTGVLQMN